MLSKLLVPYLLSPRQLNDNNYPRPHPRQRGMAVFNRPQQEHQAGVCFRCKKRYTTNSNGFPTNTSPCVYHEKSAFKRRWGYEYSCCDKPEGSKGCSENKYHVYRDDSPQNQTGYVQTTRNEHASRMVYALDCEMCYTTKGLEVTKVTVVGEDLQIVYETLIRPSNPILDYNTRFSGITERKLNSVTTTLPDVQARLLDMFNSETILVGHSLESDLKALKLIHECVVDTSLVFPHKRGLPFKRALRNICADFLYMSIQDNEKGHDSAEDARACMQLMEKKAKGKI